MEILKIKINNSTELSLIEKSLVFPIIITPVYTFQPFIKTVYSLGELYKSLQKMLDASPIHQVLLESEEEDEPE